jgi:LmbE family N-acetylglucosaminyl deacetylase
MKKLVLAPHVDDDVLGCGGILDGETVTFYCGVDEMHVVSEDERRLEAVAVAERTGGAFYWPGRGALAGQYRPLGSNELSVEYATDRVVNHYDIPSLIGDFERVIGVEKPDEVYIAWPSYNQDHRAAYEAALVALRPHDQLHRVSRVLVYEGSQINFWDHATPGAQFQPSLFVPIDIDEKIARYSLMLSQVRGMRSAEHLRALATLRGGEIGVPAAEAFAILRWIGGP